ncbi:MAG TPA: PaaI family thioesterase, partial [Candidatus Thalassarchaeaceae archaeon]|nr:PaaI family thioesterase [Candidatus Thalassarchaeaceae archaeon]
MIGHNQLSIADIQDQIDRSLFHQLFKPKVLEVNNEQTELKLQVSMCPQFERQPNTNQWHGGVLASLVDIAGFSALMLVTKDRPLLTLNFSINFLRLAVSDTLIATAKVTRSGRTVGFVEVIVHNQEKEVVV